MSTTKVQTWQPVFGFGDVNDDDVETEVTHRRRVSRVDVRHWQPPVTLALPGIPGRPFVIRTIAEYGAGFFPGGQEHEVMAELKQERTAQIQIGTICIPVVVRLAYLSKDIAGVEFIQPSEKARFAIRCHFFLELTASALVPLYFEAKAANDLKLRKLIYGTRSAFKMEFIVAEDQSVRMIAGTLGPSGEIVVAWSIQEDGHFSDIRVLLTGHADMDERPLRAQMIGFMRNLVGLNPKLRANIEKVFNEARLMVSVADQS